MKTNVNEDGEIVFSEVYNPIVVKTESGEFGICERDGDLTVVRNGEEVWLSAEWVHQWLCAFCGCAVGKYSNVQDDFALCGKCYEERKD